MKTCIGENETKWLFVVLITSRIFVGAIYEFIYYSAAFAFINAIICTALAFLFFYVVNIINPNMKNDLFSVMNKSYGKNATVVIGAVLTVLSVFNSSIRLRMFANAIGDVVLPSSPLIYILLFFAAVMAAVSLFGLEPITRYGLISGIGILILTAVICIVNSGGYEISNLFSLSKTNVKNLSGSISMIYIFSDIFYLYIISDFFKSSGAVKRIGSKAILISGISVVLIIFLYSLVEPYPASLMFKYPFFRFSSLAKMSVVFQRLDGIVYIIWIFSGFICSGVLTLFTLIAFSKTFKTSDFKGTVPAMIFVIVALAFYGIRFEKVVNILFSFIAFLLPVVTMFVYRLKMQRRKTNDV